MRLRKEIVKRKDVPVREKYNIAIENIFTQDDNGFMIFDQIFIREPAKIFQEPERESEVLDFYRHCLWTLCSDERRIKQLMWLNGEYYDSVGCSNFFNSDYSRCITIHRMDKVDMNYYDNLAVRNLMFTIRDENLSLAERAIIRDIALKGFHDALERGVDSKDRTFTNLVQCVRTDLNEGLIPQLLSYGFKVEHPWKRIVDIKLRR